MSNAEQYLDEDIREEFAKHRSVFRTCRALKINVERVNRVVKQDDYRSDTRDSVYDGEGRPELRQYIVAKKSASGEWDNNSSSIKEMRALFERGTHEMCQGRDGDTIIQYLIPRAVSQPRPGYFSNRSQ